MLSTAASKQVELVSFSRDSILNPIYSVIDSANTMASNDPNPSRRLTDNYPKAHTDFGPYGAACIYKTGPAWPDRQSSIDSGYTLGREARPVYGHPITTAWLRIGERILKHLDFLRVLWSTINPLAYAYQGEAKAFCPLLILIGVIPDSLSYESARAAAHDSKDILVEEGFPDIEVAMVESVTKRHSGHFLSFDPPVLLPDLVKPFTLLLGIPISLLEHPNLVGTGGLIFNLGQDSDNKPIIGLLTCAHVALPTPVYGKEYQTGRVVDEPSRRIEYIALGEAGYKKVVDHMRESISAEQVSIEKWTNRLEQMKALSVGDEEESQLGNEPFPNRQRFEKLVEVVGAAQKRVSELETLHTEVHEKCATPSQRLLGSLLYSAPLQVPSPERFTSDWAMIAIDPIQHSKLMGNNIYIGDSIHLNNIREVLYPYEKAQGTGMDLSNCPDDGLLQVAGVVEEDEIRNPKTLDEHGEPCMFAIKNGIVSGTTVGRVNGLESFVRTFGGDEKITTREIAVVGRKCQRNSPFSQKGDSGAIVVTRDGRILGLLNGGNPDSIDISYITPYWWLERQIKEKFPGSYLYEGV